jgi:hypothetical protein
MNDPTEALITQSLESHAADAPSDDTLLSGVHTRLRRRRLARTTGAVVLACAAVATAVTGVHSLADNVSPSPAPSVAQPPPGWHWESYSNIQVQVPDGWREGSASPLWACMKKKPAGPEIGRPIIFLVSPMDAHGCGVEAPALALRVPHLFFDFNPRAGIFPRDHGWTEETRVIDGLGLSVFSDDDAVRRRILDSATLINGTDVNGCAPSHPAALRPDLRPASGSGLSSIGEVESLQICAYWTGAGLDRPPLLASAEISGDRARAVGDALLAAPEVATGWETAGDPNLRLTGVLCGVGTTEILVLKVHGGEGDQEVLVRYTECVGNGFDDGTTVRRLTKAALQPLLTAVGRPEAMTPFIEQLLR